MSYKKIVSIFSLTMHNISHVYAEDASTQAPARLRRSLSEEIVTNWPRQIKVTSPYSDYTGTYVRTQVGPITAWTKKDTRGQDVYLYEDIDESFGSIHRLRIGPDTEGTSVFYNDINDGFSISSGWKDSEGKDVGNLTVKIPATSQKSYSEFIRRIRAGEFGRRITRQRLLRGSSFVEYQSMVAIEDIVAA